MEVFTRNTSDPAQGRLAARPISTPSWPQRLRDRRGIRFRSQPAGHLGAERQKTHRRASAPTKAARPTTPRSSSSCSTPQSRKSVSLEQIACLTQRSSLVAATSACRWRLRCKARGARNRRMGPFRRKRRSAGGHGFRRVITGSVADAGLWASLSAEFDFVIHCASSGRGGEPAYEEVYLKGALMMNAHQARARRYFVSSTSVYGQTEGEIVTEKSPAEPSRRQAGSCARRKKVALAAGAVVVRSSGIYGPKRGVLFEKFRRGEAVIEGDGLRWINQIHQRDLVAALVHLIDRGQPGRNLQCDRRYAGYAARFLRVVQRIPGASRCRRTDRSTPSANGA